MADTQALDEAVDLLQDLGLKEYEARCFVALAQLQGGTAKRISEISEVPRTRVYDAIRVLESQGLVEVQHSNPQRYRAVSIDEATTTLRQKYDDRIETLRTYLESVEVREDTHEDDRMQEVWSLAGQTTIESRTYQLIEGADSEIVLVVVDENALSKSLFEYLREAIDRDITVVAGGLTDSVISRFESELPSAQVFETGLDWLVGSEAGSEVAIGRLMLVDRTTLLVSSFYPTEPDDGAEEFAVYANGLGNGVVVLIRRLLSTGLLASQDPGR